MATRKTAPLHTVSRPSGAQGDTALAPELQRRMRTPPLYKVLLLNDDYTPMDFVVVVLCKFFNMSLPQATTVMLQVHRAGRGLCGVFPHDIAATKVGQVVAFSQQHQHPLICMMEEN